MKATRSGIAFEQGEIVLISFPFSDLTQAKQRPVLVLSKKDHNDSSSDFVCCGITSNLANKRYSVLLDKNEIGEGSIPKQSRIKFNKIFTLEKTLVRKKLGKISDRKLKQVQQSLAELLM
ncbi:MAG: type II toxin-antitoxin system PemK/MazF family toxin [Candidatus Nitrosotenuis sp.]